MLIDLTARRRLLFCDVHHITKFKKGSHHETDQQNHRYVQQHERLFRHVQSLIAVMPCGAALTPPGEASAIGLSLQRRLHRRALQLLPFAVHAFSLPDKVVSVINIPDHRIVIATRRAAHRFVAAKHPLR